MRLLPVLIIVLSLTLGLKLLELSTYDQQIQNPPSFIADTIAQSDEEDEAEDDEQPMDAPEESAAPAPTPSAQPPVQEEFSRTEIEILQSLSQRREELEQYEKSLKLRETILKATEERIESKIAELSALKQDVDALLAKYNEKEEAKIRSLVKIYENMKPKDAARIFEEIDMDVLLEVVDRMSERKIAPVLAKMQAKRAKEITTELAKRKKLPEETEELETN